MPRCFTKNSAHDMMREWAHCGDEASDHQLPIAVPFESPKLFLLLFQLNAKFDAVLLLYLLSHFKCDGYTVHMLIQWHPPPLLTSTGRLSLFTHVHSSPLSLAARLHGCYANPSNYISNDFFQTDLVYCLRTLNNPC